MLEALGVQAVDLGVVELAAPSVDDIAVRRHGLYPPAVDQADVKLELSSL